MATCWGRKLVTEGTRSILPDACTCNGFGYDKRGGGARVFCDIHANAGKKSKVHYIEAHLDEESDVLRALAKRP